MVTILPPRAFVHSTEDLTTTNALVPLFAYLALNNGRFPDAKAIDHAVNWLYAALIWARYTSQTDQRLEADVQLVVKEGQPWDALRKQIIEQRGRIEVTASDLEGRGALHPLYRAAFILAKAHGAIDWFNGASLGQTHGPAYAIHSHHIFTQSLLYDNGWDPDNYVHRQAVNEIANRAFLTASSNFELSASEPADYLPLVEARYPGALASQFVPIDPDLWRLERYRDFLNARRELFARKLNEFMASLISEPEETHYRPTKELIELGESSVLEFKSTFQWDVIKSQVNTELRKSILKTVAAFLNTEGGTLIIGLEDGGNVAGLDRDLATMNGSRDKFEQLLVSQIKEYIGLGYAAYYRIRFDIVDEKLVCIVDVDRAHEPVFMKTEKGREFFIRVGNTTRALDAEEFDRYRDSH